MRKKLGKKLSSEEEIFFKKTFVGAKKFFDEHFFSEKNNFNENFVL